MTILASRRFEGRRLIPRVRWERGGHDAKRGETAAAPDSLRFPSPCVIPRRSIERGTADELEDRRSTRIRGTWQGNRVAQPDREGE